MRNDEEIIKSLISGGLIGATLGALLSERKGDGAALSALAGAVLLATYKANERAREMQVPFYVEENGFLYQIQADGSKEFVRQLEQPTVELPNKFRLK